MDGLAVDAPAVRYDPQSFQGNLRGAKERYGSALCNCKTSPLQLVIRERMGKLFLAAWPDQAAIHALDCPFYSEHRESAGRYAPEAIERDGDVTRVALSHPLMHQNRNQEWSEPKERAPATTPGADRGQGPKTTMHLWGLVHYLWEEAGLNRWYPGWHRDWGLVRYLLRRVAQNTMVGDKPLLDSLYIPPVWNSKKQYDIQQHWNQFHAILFKNNRRCEMVASGFVIGTVRSLEQSEFGNVIQLHHHSARFYMDQRISDNVAHYSRRGWAAAKHLEVASDSRDRPYVVAAMRVESSSTGRMAIVEVALMRVSPRYIPVSSSYEDRLARHLIELDRQFVKPLHYDNHNIALPDFVLKDVLEVDGTGGEHANSVAIYVYGPAITPQQKPRIEAADRKYAKEAGLGYWQWDVAQNRELPDLPLAIEKPVRLSSSQPLQG